MFKTTDLILNTKDYTFKHFAHEGLGGATKYIATSKTDTPPRKLIVKHNCEFAVASNGFVFGRIGELLGMTIPKTYMFNVALGDERLFDTPCVMGMEFIDGLEPFDIAIVKADEKLKKAFVECFALHALLTSFSDSIQICYVPGDTLYPFDFDDSFSFDKLLFNIISRSQKFAELEVPRMLQNIADKGVTDKIDFCYKILCEKLGYDAIKKDCPYFYEFLERFCALTEEEISSVTDALNFLPDLVSIYYEEYISITQESTRTYLAQNFKG